MDGIVNYIKYRHDKKIKNTPNQSEVFIPAKKYAETSLVTQPMLTTDKFLDFCKTNNKDMQNFVVLAHYYTLVNHSNDVAYQYTLVGEKVQNSDALQYVKLIRSSHGPDNKIAKECIGVSLKQSKEDFDIWQSIDDAYNIYIHPENAKLLAPYKHIIKQNISAMVNTAVINDIKAVYEDNIDSTMYKCELVGIKVKYSSYFPIFTEVREGVCSNKQLKKELCATLDKLRFDRTEMPLYNFINKYKKVHNNLLDKQNPQNVL